MNKYQIPNLAKACEVLEFISNAPHGCSLKEVCMALSIPRTTALRITQTLVNSDYLLEKEDRTLSMGSAVIQLGVKALDSIDVRSYARPILQALSLDTNKSSHLAMLNGTKSMLVEVCDTPHPLRIAARPGTLVDLHSSSTGKIFLAYCIEDPQTFCKKLELTRHTPNTHTTIKEVLAGIKETRRNGFAIDDEEYTPGIRCIAAPIINAFGITADALGITSSTATFPKKHIKEMAKKVTRAAEEISLKLGHAR